MTPHEIVDLLDKMSIYWPHTPPADDQTILWTENLANIKNGPMAHDTVAALMETTRFYTHWSEFMDEYRNQLAIERRDSQVIARAPEPRETEPLAPEVRSLSKRIVTGPPCGRLKAEALVRALSNAWTSGHVKDPELWVTKLARMDEQNVIPAIEHACDSYTSMTWTQFMKNHYLPQVDKTSIAQHQDAR